MNSQREHIESLFGPQSVTTGRVGRPVEADALRHGQPDGQDPLEHFHALERELTTLRGALETRDVIGMAKGILMARQNCGPDEAFDILRRASQRTNRKLAEIATDIVASNGRCDTAGA